MGKKRMGSSMVGFEGRVFRRGEQEVDRRLRGQTKRETSPGYPGYGHRRLRIFVGRVLLLHGHGVDWLVDYVEGWGYAWRWVLKMVESRSYSNVNHILMKD